jgi:hypothetical protein
MERLSAETVRSKVGEQERKSLRGRIALGSLQVLLPT